MAPVRVLIVDDSATIRALLTNLLSQDPQIEVVGAAPEPAVARQMIKDLNPDVLTLDIEMPNMNGLQFLEKIMRLRPMPVVMVSTLTEAGAEVTLDALAIGAVDFFAKPTRDVASSLGAAAAELRGKVKAAARAQLRPLPPAPKPAPAERRDFGDHLIAIGSSTGGVEALLQVLSAFPANCPPTVITQHMPAGFTTSFAKRLDRVCKPSVAEASDGAVLAPGTVMLAPGGLTHLEVSGRGPWRCHLMEGEAMSGHRPSVDRLFHSVARTAGSNAIGVILTGMGRDGAAGLAAMRQAGAQTIGQDAASSIVYGMPRAAFELGAVEAQWPLEKIGGEIMRLASRQHAGGVS